MDNPAPGAEIRVASSAIWPYARVMTPLDASPRPTLSPAERTYDLGLPDGEAGRVVFASPHSGATRPDDMGEAPGLSELVLRSAEDVGVDRLIASGRAGGAPIISGRVSRAYVDLNRAPEDLDPALIEGVPDGGLTAKVAAGFGVLPRRAGDGTALYERKLSLAEAQARLAEVHAPYHAALEGLMLSARERCGQALLIDWHSMPSRAAGPARGRGGRGLDVVLGDRHGSACRGETTRRVRALFEAQGWRVALNTPYAGGYSTERWGRPDEGFQAIQVELNRALYLDEATLQPSADYKRFARALDRVIAALTAEAWLN